MTRSDRLYRVWLERELGKISTEEAFERVEAVMCAPVDDVLPHPSKRCRSCGGAHDSLTPWCAACKRRHEQRAARSSISSAENHRSLTGTQRKSHRHFVPSLSTIRGSV